jgi:hypothetical protein
LHIHHHSTAPAPRPDSSVVQCGAALMPASTPDHPHLFEPYPAAAAEAAALVAGLLMWWCRSHRGCGLGWVVPRCLPLAERRGLGWICGWLAGGGNIELGRVVVRGRVRYFGGQVEVVEVQRQKGVLFAGGVLLMSWDGVSVRVTCRLWARRRRSCPPCLLHHLQRTVGG